MKKFFSVVLMLSLCTVLAVCTFAADYTPGPSYDIPMCTKAPVIDGVISENEYKLMGSFEDDREAFIFHGATVGNKKMDWYATYDNSFFYLAVVATCSPEHVALHEDNSELYIFNAHHVMTSMLPDDPAQDKYLADDGGTEWDWSEAHAAGFANEWTIIRNSDYDELDYSNHFGEVALDENYQYEVACAGGYDIYEQRIPWSAIGKDACSVGDIVGLALQVGLSDMGTGYTDDGDMIFVSNGINNGKRFVELARLTLQASSELDSRPSSDYVITEEQTTAAPVEDTTAEITFEQTESAADTTIENNNTETPANTATNNDTTSEPDKPLSSGAKLTVWIVCGVVIAAAIAVTVVVAVRRKK